MFLGAHLAAAVNKCVDKSVNKYEDSAADTREVGDEEVRRLRTALCFGGVGGDGVDGGSAVEGVPGAGVRTPTTRRTLPGPPPRVIELGCGGGPSGLGLAAAVAAGTDTQPPRRQTQSLDCCISPQTI